MVVQMTAKQELDSRSPWLLSVQVKHEARNHTLRQCEPLTAELGASSSHDDSMQTY